MTSSSKSDTALRTIGEVAAELDVATHVLRFWESKFHQIKPQKRRGRRYYRPEDVTTITKIKELLYEQGYTIRGVQKYLLAELKSKNEDNAKTKQTNVEPIQKVSSDPTPSASLNPALFNNNSASKPTQPDFTSFKTDMFGNIVPANASNAGVVVNQNPVKTSSPAAKEPYKGYGEDDVKKLQQIYNGLQEARKRLKDVA